MMVIPLFTLARMSKESPPHAKPLGEGRLSWIFDKKHLVDTCPSIQDGRTLHELSQYKFQSYDFANQLINALNLKLCAALSDWP